MKSKLILLAMALACASCTENQRAKKYGGETSVQLPIDQKLVTVTWKGSNLWYLTRPMRSDEKPENYSFKEESSWGVMEGTIILKESKK